MPARIIAFVAPINILLNYLLGDLFLVCDCIMELMGDSVWGLNRFALGLLERLLRLPSHII